MTRPDTFSLHTAQLLTRDRVEDDTAHVPLQHAMSSMPVIAALMLLTSAALVTGPTAQDQYALIGAVCAAVITLVAVRKYDQSLWNGISAFIGALIVGVTMPGATVSWAQYQGYVDDHTYQFLTWHSWMLLGFVFGLGGWIVAQSIYQFFVKKVPEWLTRVTEKLEAFFFSK